MWAMPDEDDAVKGLFRDFAAAFENPRSLSDFVPQSL
jgi:molecular chaperone Hsp31 and glyoxalase 3